MSLADFGCLAEENDEIDRRLDSRMVELAAQQPGAVLEGRVTGWMAHRHDLAAFKVWVAARLQVRASRVGGRDGQAQPEAIAAVRQRETSEHSRYADHYGIDLQDLTIYDLVLHSDEMGAEQLAERVQSAAEAAQNALPSQGADLP